jgi:hypothetical protein
MTKHTDATQAQGGVAIDYDDRRVRNRVRILTTTIGVYQKAYEVASTRYALQE